MVENSYLSHSDEVVKLMERVEASFIKHFANANRRHGMRDLRPRAKRDKHRVTFLVGCFFGCSIALVLAIILTVHARGLLKSEGPLSSVLPNLDMEMDERTLGFTVLPELVPLGLVIVVLMIMLCPFNIIYCANLRFSYSGLQNSIYAITVGETLRGDRTHVTKKDYGQAKNGLKYLSTIIAVITRTIYVQRRGMTMRIIAASSSGVATIYNTYWDMVKDWGLLCRNSKNPWLRDRLIIPNKWVYFVAMVVNVILRLAWMQTVLDFHEAPWIHRSAMTFVVAVLEIIRRGISNFFRLENEHLNNVGNFRAFKLVPLPFSYEDGDKDL
uniref:EXS domain-containing protein n=1 Tax=Tanacetum cinerariifolium TaxID=118510 RepID=A0A6L2J3L0_TANCI|nr:hypothetical protein [Tanacetum cinerariifolium]